MEERKFTSGNRIPVDYLENKRREREREENGNKGKKTETKGRKRKQKEDLTGHLAYTKTVKNLKAWRGFSSALEESGVRSSTCLMRLDLRVDAP